MKKTSIKVVMQYAFSLSFSYFYYWQAIRLCINMTPVDMKIITKKQKLCLIA